MINSNISAEELNNCIIISKFYGRGTIINALIEPYDIKLTINFWIDKSSTFKMFSAKTAILNGAIYFEDEEMQSKIYNIFNNKNNSIVEEKNETKLEVKPVAVKSGIFKNKNIEKLVNKLINNESIAIDLISLYDDINFENDIINEGYSYFEKILNNEKLKIDYYFCIVVMLSFIALKYYDGDFHSQIYSSYNTYCNGKSFKYNEVKLIKGYYNIIDKCNLINKVKYFPTKNKRYDAVPNILACVPYYRVGQLYVLAYDIYKKKLLFDEDITDDQIECKVKEVLTALKRKDLVNDSDTIKGTNYLMSKYTQSCIYSGYNLDVLTSIISHCIRLIINHLTRLEDSFIVEAFYKQGYDFWVNSFESNFKERENYEKSRLLSSPYFTLINKTHIYLITGKYCMDDIYNPNNVFINIYNNDDLISSYKLDGPNDVLFNDDETMGGYIISSKKFVLNCNPLGHLSYRIVCDDKELYNSKTRLYRSAIFFDGRGKEVKPGTEYNGNIIAVVKALSSDDEEIDEKYKCFYNGNEYKIYEIEVNNTDIFRFNDEPYVFYKINDPKLLGYQVPWASFESMEGKEYAIYKDISVLFQASCNKEDIYIKIDDLVLTFGEMNGDARYKICLFANEHNGMYAYLIEILNLSAGYHKLKIYNQITNKMIANSNFDFIYDSNLKKIYQSNDERKTIYNFESSLIETPMLIEYNFGETLYQMNTFVNGLGYGKMNIYPSMISYSTDNIQWYGLNKKFYLCDIPMEQEKIFIIGPSNLSAYLKGKKGILNKRLLNLVQNKDDKYRYELSLNYLRTLDINLFKSVKVTFEYGLKSRFVMVGLVPFVDRSKCEFFYDENYNCHNFKIVYENKCKLCLVVKPVNTDTIIFSTLLQSNNSTVSLDANKITSDVHFVSISLHMASTGSIFKKYNDNPILTFPKYCVEKMKVKFIQGPEYKVTPLNQNIIFNFIFEGINHLLLKIVPSSFNNKELYKKIISFNEEVKFDTRKEIYNAYNILLYKPIDGNELVYEDKAFYVSPSIKVDSRFIYKKLKIRSFLFSDDKPYYPKIYFYYAQKIDEINGKNMLLGCIKNENNKVILEDILVYIVEQDNLKAIGNIYIKKEHKLGCIKYTKENKIIKKVILDF